MTDQVDRRADQTRLQILQAAAHQLAVKPYSQVNLDDILDDASVTKGALYFHFRSKHELATAIVQHGADVALALFDQESFATRPGMESMIEVSFVIAAEDIRGEMTRAGFNLLEALGRFDGLQSKILEMWVSWFTDLARDASEQDDVVSDADPGQVAKLLVSLYMGLRQTGNLHDPAAFLHDLEASWLLVLPGFANPARLDYLKSFTRRRTALAIKNAVPFRADNL